MLMKVTMHDVASLSGVSTATVSHVLNNSKRISDETRKKVLDAAEKLNYRPNYSAKSFRTGKTFLIGFVVPDISNVYFATLIEQIESIITPLGYNLLVANTSESIARERKALRSLCSSLVDGLVLASTSSDFSEISEIIPPDLPVVLIDRTIPHCDRNTVIISSGRAVEEAVFSLVSSGHSRIGFIAGLPHLSTTSERLDAYKNALNKCNIPFSEELLCYGNSMHDSGKVCIEKLLKQKCSAVIVSNSLMTDDVLLYLSLNGIEIGKDITIVGFVDSPRFNILSTSVPVIIQPSVEMGRFAGERIIELITNPMAKSRDCFLYSVYQGVKA